METEISINRKIWIPLTETETKKITETKRKQKNLTQKLINLAMSIFVSVVFPFHAITQVLLSHDALAHSAVLRLHVVRLSLRLFVRPSVHLSVTLVDQDHIGWKSWKLIARSIRPTPLLFVAQRPST